MESSKSKPYKLFIGSSSESLKTANRIKQILNNQAKKESLNLECSVWDSYPEKNEYNNETFTNKFDRVLTIYDFALFVLSDDDILLTRGLNLQATRDNVWLEAGMFIGRKGIENVFLFLNMNDFKNFQIPSDLEGIILEGVNWNTDILRLFYNDSRLFSKSTRRNSIHYKIKNKVSNKIDDEIKKYCKKVVIQIKNRIQTSVEKNVAKILLGREECYDIGLNLIKEAQEQLYTTISFKDSLIKENNLEKQMYDALVDKIKESQDNTNDLVVRRYFKTSNENIRGQYDDLKKELKKLLREEDEISKILIENEFDYLELIISDCDILMVFPNYSGADSATHNRVEFGFLIENNKDLSEKLRDWLLVKIGKNVHSK